MIPRALPRGSNIYFFSHESTEYLQKKNNTLQGAFNFCYIVNIHEDFMNVQLSVSSLCSIHCHFWLISHFGQLFKYINAVLNIL